MKSASFLCPYDSVFKVVPAILKRKGCTVLVANTDNGIIKAQYKNSLFAKRAMLDVKIYKIDDKATGLKLMVNSHAAIYDTARTMDEFKEERLLNTINKYF